MQFFPARLPVLALIALVGCGSATETVRYSAPPPSEDTRVTIALQSVSLREVSLPAYAAEEGIAVATGTGAITNMVDNIWADDPTRAVTLRLTNALADLTGRVIAADPWPFRDEPEAVVEVRFEDFVAETSGRFTARGRYYVAHQTVDRADRALSFALSEAYDPAQGFAAIADARSRVISALARDIAQRGLR